MVQRTIGDQALGMTRTSEDGNMPHNSNRPRKGILLFGEDHHVIPLDRVERATIWNAIRHYHGDMTQVAQRLEISRGMLYRKVKKYNLYGHIERCRNREVEKVDLQEAV